MSADLCKWENGIMELWNNRVVDGGGSIDTFCNFVNSVKKEENLPCGTTICRHQSNQFLFLTSQMVKGGIVK